MKTTATNCANIQIFVNIISQKFYRHIWVKVQISTKTIVLLHKIYRFTAKIYRPIWAIV